MYLILTAVAYLFITLKSEWIYVLSEFMLHLAVNIIVFVHYVVSTYCMWKRAPLDILEEDMD